MNPFKLEAKHMIKLNDTAFQKGAATKLMRELIKHPDAVVEALQNTQVRFSLIPQENRAVRLG